MEKGCGNMSLEQLNRYISWDALNITKTDVAEIIILEIGRAHV